MKLKKLGHKHNFLVAYFVVVLCLVARPDKVFFSSVSIVLLAILPELLLMGNVVALVTFTEIGESFLLLDCTVLALEVEPSESNAVSDFLVIT